MTFNSLLMFDVVFVFFLFLVGVTCLVYYLPPSKQSITTHCRVNHNSSSSSAHNDHINDDVNNGPDHDDDDNADGDSNAGDGNVSESNRCRHTDGSGLSGHAVDYSRGMHQRCQRQCYYHHQLLQQQQLHHNAQNYYHVHCQQIDNNRINYHCEQHQQRHRHRLPSIDHNHERLKIFNCKHHHEHCSTRPVSTSNYRRLSNNIEYVMPEYSSGSSASLPSTALAASVLSVDDERFEVSLQIPPPPSPPSSSASSFCYIKAKRTEMKNGAGPIEDV